MNNRSPHAGSAFFEEEKPMSDKNTTNEESPENEIDFEMFVLPRRIEKALSAIHEYLWEEERDFFSMPEKQRKGHIWASLSNLQAWRVCPFGRLRFPRKGQ
jgi:hypothetical protein